jgi:hypothetical protein
MIFQKSRSEHYAAAIPVFNWSFYTGMVVFLSIVY